MRPHVLVALLAGTVAASTARASFHLMEVEQVIGGVNGNTSVQAIQLRTRALGQNLVSQARLVVRDANGVNPITVVDMASNVANSAAGARVLIATSNLASFTSPPLSPDFVITTPIPASYLDAGTLTFESDGGIVYWRLSWGGASYAGPGDGATTNDADGNFNPPFPAPLPRCGLASVRFRFGTALSTNNANDYEVFPAPVLTRNNGSTSTVTGPAGSTGACCAGTGCAVTTACDCAAMGGSYRGDGVACSPAQCPFSPGTDEDGDGVDEMLDCDDRNAQVSTSPVGDLLVSFPSASTITWTPPSTFEGSGMRYDLLRSTVRNNFDAPTGVCLANDTLLTNASDPATPPQGSAFYYLVRAHNACGDGGLGVTSAGIPRTGNACPPNAAGCSVTITRSPQSIALCAGEDAPFSILAAGSGTAHYQWKKNGVNVGADSPTLTLPAVPSGDNGALITCVVTDNNCARTSSTAVLTVFATAASCSGGGTGLEAPNGGHAPPDTPDPGVHPARDGGGVYLHSGEFYLEETDLRIPGRGFPFTWSRKYRSREGRLTAMGDGWDFSYNRMIALDADGTGRYVYDGNSRRDDYRPISGSCWAATGLFRELCLQGDQSYVLTFPNKTTWKFARLDAPVAPGKITEVKDRNGNVMTFAYDGSGRLSAITDTLNRTITVSYNASGFVSTVTDFIGRQVRYGYFNPGDSGGTPSDLKSVTTPNVTGQPPGNNFPTGKTTTYTYSKDMAQPALNHNLLTITDPLGQTYLRNVYTTTETPANGRFDRLDRQRYPNGTIEYVYIQQTPSPANNQAVSKTIVNDRAGNVREAFYNLTHQAVMLREYTGRAPDRTLPTDDSFNRPTGKLRPTPPDNDPAFFEWKYTWSADSLLTTRLMPEGSSFVHTYDASNPNVRLRANRLQRSRLPGPRAGDQAQILEAWGYTTTFGAEPCVCPGCCGEGGGIFATSHQDGRANTTVHQFDASGNRLHTNHRNPAIMEDWEYNASGQVTAHVLPDNGSGRRRDEYTYYSAGPQRGYLQSEKLDAPGFNLTTTYEYDAVGNVVRMTDPRGHAALFSVNQLNQVVTETSREVADGSGIRYQVGTFYDAADRIVRTESENRDETGALQDNASFTTTYRYDALNRTTRMVQEVDGTHGVAEEYQYDANDHLLLTKQGASAGGSQPRNTVKKTYDERDLVFRTIRAEGDPDQSTVQSDYDLNGNLKARRQGIESAPRVTTYAHDGYDRGVGTTDAMGNTTTRHYDANGNVVSVLVEGELEDVVGSAGNVPLSETLYQYDAMDRPIRTDMAFFDATTQTPIGDGQVTTETYYNDDSSVYRVVDDNANETLTDYDTASRRSVVTDPKGNRVSYHYDANGNVVMMTELEKSDLGDPDEVFTTEYAYDNLDRLVETTDSVDNSVQYAYDSRGNRVLVIDALQRASHSDYDGLDRLVLTVHDLDADGADGDGSDITIGQSWDDSSRLSGRTDDNSNTTAPLYDELDRVVSTDMADCTAPSATYDVHGNKTSEIDANETQVTYTYDLLDRVTQKSITPGPDVAGPPLGTSFEIYRYDGLSRVVRAEDDDSIVTREYDSLGRVTKETQTFAGGPPPAVVTSVYDGVGNRTQVAYPGGRLITTLYDELDRKKTITDGPATIATYDYVGPRRLERRSYGNGTRTEDQYDGIPPNAPGDFGVRKIVRTTHTVVGTGAIIDDRTYTWDEDGNKTERKDERIGGPRLEHAYVVDGANRLVQTTVRNAASTIVRDTSYALDGVGNRQSVTGLGTPDAGSYTEDEICPVADFEMNQYSTTPMNARAYDDSGNLMSLAGQASVLYDYTDRMVQYTDTAAVRRHTYAYDAFGRRIAKVVDADGAAGGPFRTRFLADGWQEIEEQDFAGATQATYVFGNSVDEALTMKRGTASYYFHTDDLHSVMAVTSAGGVDLERYEYADYGAPSFYSGAGTPRSSSIFPDPLLFTGRRYDAETGLYYYRNRYLDPRAGRFTTRDPIGGWGDAGSLGSAYSYAGSNPATATDPLGLTAIEPEPRMPEPTAEDFAIAAWARAENARKAREEQEEKQRVRVTGPAEVELKGGGKSKIGEGKSLTFPRGVKINGGGVEQKGPARVKLKGGGKVLIPEGSVADIPDGSEIYDLSDDDRRDLEGKPAPGPTEDGPRPTGESTPRPVEDTPPHVEYKDPRPVEAKPRPVWCGSLREEIPLPPEDEQESREEKRFSDQFAEARKARVRRPLQPFNKNLLPEMVRCATKNILWWRRTTTPTQPERPPDISPEQFATGGGEDFPAASPAVGGR